MNTSYKWLQTYFEKPLPEVDKLAELLTFGAFEIEGVEKKGGDWMIDVDVLPNRAHDSLGHRGVAQEIGVLLGVPLVEKRSTPHATQAASLSVAVEEPHLCRRYVGRKIKNIKVGASPEWLRERLEAIGQRSINNIVDATNYMMFDLGQPCHAFDADKISKGVVVRKAKSDEHITTLDGKEVELSEQVLVIADSDAPLAIAGIKGGKKAELDGQTTNLILEAANFEPSNIRKSTRVVNIKTDSSKRFENEITPELAAQAMEELTALILEIAATDETVVEEVVDVNNSRAWQYKVGVSAGEVNKVLGTALHNSDIEKILSSLGFAWEKVDPRKKVLAVAQSTLGSTYKRPSSMRQDAPEAFSCTSLISHVFVEAGIYMPSLSVDKYVYGAPVAKEDLQPGDVIFVNTGEGSHGEAPKIYHETVEYMPGSAVPEGVDHAGIYMGEGKVLHTSWKFGEAVIEDLDKSEQFQHIVGYRSFIPSEDERYVVKIPHERLDLRIKEDLIEEIARVYGYTNITGEPIAFACPRVINKRLYYMNRVRAVLESAGYSENYGYTFRGAGDIEMEKSLAQGKDFLRTNLSDGMHEAIDFNDRYKDLLAIDRVRMFEFGSVFTHEREWMSFVVGLGASKQKGECDALALLNEKFGTKLSAEIFGKQGGVFEIDFDALVESLPEPDGEEVEKSMAEERIAFKSISPYPFVTRDIAVWTASGTEADGVFDVIKKEAGELLVQHRLFDVYEKDGKISYAFNLIFQSPERTLTDEEINEIMGRITAEMEKNKWEVR